MPGAPGLGAASGSRCPAESDGTLAAVRAALGHSGDNDDRAALAGRCLDFAWEGYRILRTWPGAPRTILQAGSAQWPRVPPAMDDGTSPTHFAYQWEPNRERPGGDAVVGTRHDPLVLSLPEVHVWLGCPDTGEIIDFSTGLWPLSCELALGLPWPGPLPPDYFWNFGSRRPAGVNYLPDRDAIDLVVALLRLQGRRYP